MKLAHLEAMGLVCPGCRAGSIIVSQALRVDAGELEQGILQCTHRGCEREFPVIDGIPILVRELRQAVANQLLSILARDDVSETILAVLGECAGPSSPFDATRQHLSSYVSGHWGDHDPGERSAGERPASVARVLERGLERLAALGRGVSGPILDLGCSVGRTTMELARRHPSTLVVGADLNFSMLRVARRALRERRVRYARRRVGLVFEERSFDVPGPGPDAPVELVCADVLALPFRSAAFGLASSLNLIDCVTSPLDHLRGVQDALRPGGSLVLATPFDWSPGATPVEAWLGGHSPRGPAGGRAEDVLRSLVGGGHPLALAELELLEETRGLEWLIRLHDRAVMRYEVDLYLVGKRTAAAS